MKFALVIALVSSTLILTGCWRVNYTHERGWEFEVGTKLMP